MTKASTKPTGRVVVSDRDRVVSALSHFSSNCCRDDWHQIASALKSSFGEKDGFLLFSSWSRRGYGDDYDPGSCRDTWRCALDDGFDLSIIFRRALDDGWVDPRQPNPDYLNAPKPRKSKSALPVVSPLSDGDTETQRHRDTETRMTQRHRDTDDTDDTETLRLRRQQEVFPAGKTLSVFQFDSKDFPSRLIPSRQVRGNRQEFDLARWIMATFPDATLAQQLQIVRKWFDVCSEVIGDKDVGAVIQGYKRAIKSIAYAEGDDPVSNAWASVQDEQPIPQWLEDLGYTEYPWRVIRALWALSCINPDGIFWVTVAKLAQATGKAHSTAGDILKNLVLDGITEVVYQGHQARKLADGKSEGPKASRYRFVRDLTTGDVLGDTKGA